MPNNTMIYMKKKFSLFSNTLRLLIMPYNILEYIYK